MSKQEAIRRALADLGPDAVSGEIVRLARKKLGRNAVKLTLRDVYDCRGTAIRAARRRIHISTPDRAFELAAHKLNRARALIRRTTDRCLSELGELMAALLKEREDRP
jgi:poly-gamma-glutamate capsule biosynthesis protein CapA/YwtB (metallophosphatase superfamily)